MEQFRQEIQEVLMHVDSTLPMDALNPAWETLYSQVAHHALSHKLRNTALILPLVQSMALKTGGMRNSPFENTAAKLVHCLSMACILIDLQIPLSAHDEDILLSAALCHILPADSALFLMDDILDPVIFQTVAKIRLGVSMSDADIKAYISRVQSDPLALLLRLADRGNLVESLHTFSGWSTRRYIHETRNYYLPMCLYAKQQYPELIVPVSILMEKMRSLLEVGEILLSRYETTETELMQQIQNLREENAMLREYLSKLDSAQ